MIESLLLRLFKKKLVRDFKRHCPKRIGHALLYYKTDPFLIKGLAETYAHTNNWEVLEITRILNTLGYWVDILDRDISIDDVNRIDDKYDIFIGLGAGNSGKYFASIGERLTKAVKIFYAAGPEPDESNRLIRERYAYFERRHPGQHMELRRIIDKVDIAHAMRNTDAIFCVGNEFAIDTYSKYGKRIHRINPSTSPRISTSIRDLTEKKPTSFLYFGGNGNIVKGLDILIEVFSGLPDFTLYVCAPKEPDIDAFYRESLKRTGNIHFMGFVTVGDKVFDDLTEECGYVVLPSCSEGIATSGLTCMRKGLIPVTTREAGIDLGVFGFEIGNIGIEELRSQLRDIADIPHDEFRQRVIDAYKASFDYTQAGFSEAFETSLIDVLLTSRKSSI